MDGGPFHYDPNEGWRVIREQGTAAWIEQSASGGYRPFRCCQQ